MCHYEKASFFIFRVKNAICNNIQRIRNYDLWDLIIISRQHLLEKSLYYWSQVASQ